MDRIVDLITTRDSTGDETDEEMSVGDGDDAQVSLLREKESPDLLPVTQGLEKLVSTETKLWYLAGYFALNLGLTIYNKAVMQSFRYPWLLTSIHCAFTALGCHGVSLITKAEDTKLPWRSRMNLLAFSFLFTLNIAMSNVSLAKVSVAFHQIARATCPVFIIAIQRLAFGRAYSISTYLALVPIILGVALATFGDYYFTIAGFVLTFLGVVLAAIKSVVSNQLMTGPLKLPALAFLRIMSPLAALQSFCYFLATGEARQFLAAYNGGSMGLPLIPIVAVNGVLAFAVNLASFQTNKLAGALTVTVAANLKQCLTIVLGTVLFNVHVSLVNGGGILLAMVGAAYYSKVELESKRTGGSV